MLKTKKTLTKFKIISCEIPPFGYNKSRMEKITIVISAASEVDICLQDFPELSSENKLVKKSLAIVKRYAPGILRYLSKQRALAHLPTFLIEIRSEEDIPEIEVRRRLGNWMRRKMRRRLIYVALEILLMPLAAFMAVLPGPNIFFYVLFVLFYFHMKAFLSLRKIKSENLNISLLKN
jgi:Mitochondrial K+-H+ exchange-related